MRALSQPLRHGRVERPARGLVQAGPRLVQHEQAGPGEQRLGDRDLLAHPLGQRPQRRAGVIGRTEALQPLVDRRAAPLARTSPWIRLMCARYSRAEKASPPGKRSGT